MTARDGFLDCGCVRPGSLNEPGRHFCGKPNPPKFLVERVLARHQLADILPHGVVCTCGAELAALNPPFDDASVKGEPLALAVHQLQEMEATSGERELADAETLAVKLEAVRDWIDRADPHAERNGDQFAELRRILSGPRLDPSAVLQRSARRAAGERDTAALDHCDRCHRPLPHNDAEQRACTPVAGGEA